MNPHPKGVRARVLLSSVFGPYAQDDEFGSRTINPMELYQNQVTRAQGPFSLRMFHRSWGIMMIQENISAPCTVLDFPTREAFEREVSTGRYDIVGISSIITNVGKVREMCRVTRRISPDSAIVVGGHVAAIPGLEHLIDADQIVRGEGISWMRRYLGEDENAPIRHPHIVSGFGVRSMGIQPPQRPGSTAATIIPSVGCPMGCNFCTTSSFFGGKGKFVNFYETGDELFEVMSEMESSMKVRSFFMMDENFLLQRNRAMQLLGRMKENGKSWALYVFSSANAIRKYTMEELVELGVSWVWLGLESSQSSYAKLSGSNTQELAKELHRHGIKLLGSTIVGLEHHTPENIREEIEEAVAHETDFHQFMLYTPLPGTPLHAEFSAQGRMLDEAECPLADTHGQFRFNYRHPHIPAGLESDLIVRAFQRDFSVNGPSMLRVLRTTLAVWRRYKNHPDRRIRRRFVWEVEGMATTYSAVVGAVKWYYRKNPALYAKMSRLLEEMNREFGWTSRLFAAIGGPYVLWRIRQEERRLAQGWTYEPPTFYDINDAVERGDCPSASRCRCVTPHTVSPPGTDDHPAQVQGPRTDETVRSRRVQKVP